MSDHPLTLMAVHAHPDDEAISTGGIFLRYADEGARTILVTCTRGEEGEIVQAELDTPENKARLAEIRDEELRQAVEMLKISDFYQFGYRDSGMVNTPSNEHPDCFHQADLAQATGRLVALIRNHRPHVLIGYNEEGGYGHPDHIAAHKITVAAFQASADPRQFPEAGPAWAPHKLYYTSMRRSLMLKAWRMMQERGEKTPLDNPEFDLSRYVDDERAQTSIFIADYIERKIAALKAHRTQIKDTWGFLVFPDDLRAEMLANETFALIESRVAGAAPGQRETDLFAGLR